MTSLVLVVEVEIFTVTIGAAKTVIPNVLSFAIGISVAYVLFTIKSF